jgi:hypothetical protein|tara:strand:+ start:5069 stop:5338 length:270 start_codon:yes stop_codon:yes gene_type:complete
MSHLRIGNKVNWRGAWGTYPPEEVTIIGDGMKGGEVVYDLDNGHWAYGRQLTNRAMDKALAEAQVLGEEWVKTGGSPWNAVLDIVGYGK